jgi:protein-arginine kinase activator protein McsA
VLEQFRPYVIMMRARARAEQALAAGRTKDALAAIDRGLESLRDLFERNGQAEAFEQANEVQLLRGMRDALVPKLPVSQRVELQERLQAALDAENYELAALLRDELRLMGD